MPFEKTFTKLEKFGLCAVKFRIFKDIYNLNPLRDTVRKIYNETLSTSCGVFDKNLEFDSNFLPNEGNVLYFQSKDDFTN